MMRQGFVAVVSGFLFALGLAIAGMSSPGNVIGFLDLFGSWKPALAFVMVGAIGVHGIAYAFLRNKRRPLFAEGFRLPTRRDLDARLIGGSALFGVGWGLGGFCPGPGIIAPWSGAPVAIVFLSSMLAGMWLFGAPFWGRLREVAGAGESPRVQPSKGERHDSSVA